MRRLAGWIVVALCAASDATAAGTATLIGIGDLPGGEHESWVRGVSADGDTVVGDSDGGGFANDAIRWTEPWGLEAIAAEQPDGTTAVGASLYGQFIAVTSLAELGGWYVYTDPNGLERIADGEVVGISQNGGFIAANDARGALRWTAATGAVELPPLGDDTQTRATAISADGECIVGVSSDALGIELHAVLWGPNGAPSFLGELPGGSQGATPRAISADCAVVVGQASTAAGGRAFRWTFEDGMQDLGVLAGGAFSTFSDALAVSPDGEFVFGQSTSSRGVKPFVWDARGGMRDLELVLEAEYGLDLLALGWQLYTVTGVSIDRRTIVGTGSHDVLPDPEMFSFRSEGYVLRLSTPIPEARGEALAAVAIATLVARSRKRRNGS